MISNNKLFKKFFHQKSKTDGKSVKDKDFLVESRNQWKSMTDEEKLVFANSPNASLLSASNKDIPSEADILKEIENKIIDSLVNYKTKDELMDMKLFFISSNIQCQTKVEYRPLEIGIIEYTIRNGIQMNYHQFIDCGDIPYGYICESRDHMNSTHKIPLKNFTPIASNNYLLIGSRILEVLSDSCLESEINKAFNKPMIVFSQTEQKDQNKGVLKWIANKCNEMRRREGQEDYSFNVEVLSAAKLMSSLLTIASDCHSMVWCENALTSPAFDYAVGTDCVYHEEVESIHCALGVPKRMAYLMSHFLRKPYDIKLSEKHLPTDKVFQNIRIREELEEEEPVEFKLNEDHFVYEEEQWAQEVQHLSKYEPPKEELKNEDLTEYPPKGEPPKVLEFIELFNRELKEVEVKEKETIEVFHEEEGFEQMKRRPLPFSQRTQLSHIRRRRYKNN